MGLRVRVPISFGPVTEPRRPRQGLADSTGTLHRTLGLYAVFTISIGAMIGSGIFVLPGIAFDIAGPAVVLSFVIAGLVVVPAATAKAEMATAMPEAGGTYLYIDRAMGPLMGTIAGFGVWFSLVFKAAFAIDGLGAYLEHFFDVPAPADAVVIALVLITINLIGVKQTAGVQAALVTVVFAALALFVIIGFGDVESERFVPFAPNGIQGVLSAAGLVFVSYAGVTKIASVAEEVKRPGRNIPIGILASIGIMLILYPAIVAVLVGVTPADELASSVTPMATAAEQFMGTFGVIAISVVAVLALVSMANAGLLASARYPFAMARNNLAPSFLRKIGTRSGAPIAAISVTGAMLIILILSVPLIELAKLASAFQLLVFALENLALIAFREGRLDWYRPTFRAPLYPWLQIFGILGSLVLLTQMGLVPTIGALLFIVVGIVWYRAFGKSRASRESAARDALRARADDRRVELAAAAVAPGAGRRHVLVLIRRPTRPARQRTLMRLALEFAAAPGGKIHVLHFDPTSPGAAPTAEELHRAAELGIEITTDEPGDADRRGAVHAYAENQDVDLFLADLPQELRATRHVIRDLRWLREHLSCDSVFLRNRSVGDIDTIVIMGTGGPYDPVKLGLAHRIAVAEQAKIRFVHVANEEATEAQMESIAEYHDRLGAVLTADWDSRIEPHGDLVDSLTELSRGANLVMLGAPSHRFHVVTDLADRLAESVDCPALLVHTPIHEKANAVVRWVERFIS